jgi:hypothetical protein
MKTDILVLNKKVIYMSSKEIWDVLIVGESYHPVPRFVSDWIAEPPDESEFTLPHIDVLPSNILTFCKLEEGGDDSEFEISDDWNNERALFITGYSEYFECLSEVNVFIKENNYQLGKELHFYDY